MNTLHYTKTPDVPENIPLLDKEFDFDSSELSVFIFSHKQSQVEDSYIMNFNGKQKG